LLEIVIICAKNFYSFVVVKETIRGIFASSLLIRTCIIIILFLSSRSNDHRGSRGAPFIAWTKRRIIEQLSVGIVAYLTKSHTLRNRVRKNFKNSAAISSIRDPATRSRLTELYCDPTTIVIIYETPFTIDVMETQLVTSLRTATGWLNTK